MSGEFEETYEFQIGDIIEYIDCTRNLELEAAYEWARQNDADVTELIERRIVKEDNLLHRFFQIISCPKPHIEIVNPEAIEESGDVSGLSEEARIDQEKALIREKMIDRQTIRRIRKMANHTWTPEMEAEYLRLDAEVTGYIESRFGAEYDESDSSEESL